MLRLKLPTEHDEQVAFVAEFRLRWPDAWIYAVPNGGKRSKAAAGKLKAEGVTPGVPDLPVPAWKLWIEMKRQKGRVVSKAQEEWRGHLEDAGHTVLVCRGRDDAIRQVMQFLDEQDAPEGEEMFPG